MKFVLDASVALLWLIPQTNAKGLAYADAVLSALQESQAVVPSLFVLEIANVVAKLETKGIVPEADSQRFTA
jgi:predicted nucleic acid-binding protein